MKIQIVSDLHLEFAENRRWLRENPLQPKGDILILAGDTVPLSKRRLAEEFLDIFSGEFQQILAIYGNHEFYQGEISFAYPSREVQVRDNMRYFNNRILDYEGIRFIFSTLWTEIPLAEWENVTAIMNDYRMIRKRTIFKELQYLDIEDTQNYHQYSLRFLQKQLAAASDKKVVVVTHHVPTYESLPLEYLETSLKYSYGNDLNQLIEENPQIKLWICGHCHYPENRILGQTQILRNPLGYVQLEQQRNFQRDLVIEV